MKHICDSSITNRATFSMYVKENSNSTEAHFMIAKEVLNVNCGK